MGLIIIPKLAFEKNSWSKRGLKEGWLKITKETWPSRPAARETDFAGAIAPVRSRNIFECGAGLWRSARSSFVDRVKDLYHDRMFAFDHFTLSRTPEENADAARRLARPNHHV